MHDAGGHGDSDRDRDSEAGNETDTDWLADSKTERGSKVTETGADILTVAWGQTQTSKVGRPVAVKDLHKGR